MTSVYFAIGLCLFVALVSAQDFRTAGVNKHNFYRAQHGSPNVRGVQTIHDSAQNWANYLATNNKFEHTKNGKYGENIYKAWGGSKDLKVRVEDAITSWYNEIKDYKYDKPGFQPSTGHFTQVVWRASKEVGIGAAIANDPKYGHSITVVAQYNPPGNMNTAQAFRDNVPPRK